MLVNVVRGADGPLVTKVIKEELEKEHDALENNTERTPVLSDCLTT